MDTMLLLANKGGPVLTRLLVALLALALLLGGCLTMSTAPGQTEEEEPYRLRTSPDNVVFNFVKAYESLDTARYLECLAEDLSFHLNPADCEDSGGQLPPYWGKVDERSIHEAMFNDDTDIEHISLELTNQSKAFNMGELPEDPSDDTWTYRELTDLCISVDHGDVAFLANADQELVFQIDPDETGPDGETLWEIVEWWDLPGGSGRPVEHTTWGSLKALYW